MQPYLNFQTQSVLQKKTYETLEYAYQVIKSKGAHKENSERVGSFEHRRQQILSLD